jgi:hypothetical protein
MAPSHGRLGSQPDQGRLALSTCKHYRERAAGVCRGEKRGDEPGSAAAGAHSVTPALILKKSGTVGAVAHIGFFQFQHERRSTMPLVQLVITLVVVGVILWLVNNYIPMDATIKRILNVVVVIVVILWLLSVFGVLDSLSGFRVGR